MNNKKVWLVTGAACPKRWEHSMRYATSGPSFLSYASCAIARAHGSRYLAVVNGPASTGSNPTSRISVAVMPFAAWSFPQCSRLGRRRVRCFAQNTSNDRFQVLVQATQVARAWDRDNPWLLRKQPSQCNRCGCDVLLPDERAAARPEKYLNNTRAHSPFVAVCATTASCSR